MIVPADESATQGSLQLRSRKILDAETMKAGPGETFQTRMVDGDGVNAPAKGEVEVDEVRGAFGRTQVDLEAVPEGELSEFEFGEFLLRNDGALVTGRRAFEVGSGDFPEMGVAE